MGRTTMVKALLLLFGVASVCAAPPGRLQTAAALLQQAAMLEQPTTDEEQSFLSSVSEFLGQNLVGVIEEVCPKGFDIKHVLSTEMCVPCESPLSYSKHCLAHLAYTHLSKPSEWPVGLKHFYIHDARKQALWGAINHAVFSAVHVGILAEGVNGVGRVFANLVQIQVNPRVVRKVEALLKGPEADGGDREWMTETYDLIASFVVKKVKELGILDILPDFDLSIHRTLVGCIPQYKEFFEGYDLDSIEDYKGKLLSWLVNSAVNAVTGVEEDIISHVVLPDFVPGIGPAFMALKALILREQMVKHELRAKVLLEPDQWAAISTWETFQTMRESSGIGHAFLSTSKRVGLGFLTELARPFQGVAQVVESLSEIGEQVENAKQCFDSVKTALFPKSDDSEAAPELGVVKDGLVRF
eukprot:c20865_g1_i1.p1 GENE.c20865_g1_i1~~c20865_g1_i1.p1  ORF type:complete len:413 (+),score=90.55 c20865_g1_i1:1-1239(+)